MSIYFIQVVFEVFDVDFSLCEWSILMMFGDTETRVLHIF